MARPTRSRTIARRSARKTLTKEMLLPLPSAKVRALSLENHLALAAMRSGHGNMDVVMSLARVLYLAFYMCDAARDLDVRDVFRAAEVALGRGITRAEQRKEGMVLEEDFAALEQILALHDRQMESMPAHRYTTANERLLRFMHNDAPSPIGGDGPCEANLPFADKT